MFKPEQLALWDDMVNERNGWIGDTLSLEEAKTLLEDYKRLLNIAGLAREFLLKNPEGAWSDELEDALLESGVMKVKCLEPEGGR